MRGRAACAGAEAIGQEQTTPAQVGALKARRRQRPRRQRRDGRIRAQDTERGNQEARPTQRGQRSAAACRRGGRKRAGAGCKAASAMRPTESEAHTSPRRAPQTSRSCTCGKLNTSREPMADGAECSVWTGNRRWRRAPSVTLSVRQGPACPDRPSAVCPVVEPHRSTSRRDARASLASPVRAEWLSRGDFGSRNRSVGD